MLDLNAIKLGHENESLIALRISIKAREMSHCVVEHNFLIVSKHFPLCATAHN
jgi:hypothetical protein